MFCFPTAPVRNHPGALRIEAKRFVRQPDAIARLRARARSLFGGLAGASAGKDICNLSDVVALQASKPILVVRFIAAQAFLCRLESHSNCECRSAIKQCGTKFTSQGQNEGRTTTPSEAPRGERRPRQTRQKQSKLRVATSVRLDPLRMALATFGEPAPNAPLWLLVPVYGVKRFMAATRPVSRPSRPAVVRARWPEISPMWPWKLVARKPSSSQSNMLGFTRTRPATQTVAPPTRSQ